MTYPIKHISIRVPWHDTGWDGRVCAKPRLNGACLKLKRIGQERDDAAEEAVAGQSLVDLPQEKWPCCVTERMAFMAPLNTYVPPIILIGAHLKEAAGISMRCHSFVT